MLNCQAKLLKWRFLRTNDQIDLERYGGHKAWSRIYEYPTVIELTREYSELNHNLKILNTCCGYSGLHEKFAHDLESLGTVTNSDLHPHNQGRSFNNYIFQDITESPDVYGLSNKFDVVVNVSSIEEIKTTSVLSILNNLLTACKPGGILIATIDYTWIDPLLQSPDSCQLIIDCLSRCKIPIEKGPMRILADCARDLRELSNLFGPPGILPPRAIEQEGLNSAILNGCNSREPNLDCAMLSCLLLVMHRIV